MKFEGLYDIDWDSLEHAYGPAGDVPDLINDLVGVSDGTKKKALWELFGNIHHQGTVYPAAVPAIPYLVEATAYIAPKYLSQLLDLLLCLAQGHGYFDVHQHTSAVQGVLKDMPDSEGIISSERDTVAQATLAVFEHWDVFETFTDHDALNVRLTAIEILTFLAQCAMSEPAGTDRPLAYLGVRPGGHDKDYWRKKIFKMADDRLRSQLPELEAAILINALGELGCHSHSVFESNSMLKMRPFERFVAISKLAEFQLATEKTLSSNMAKEFADIVDHFRHIEAAYLKEEWAWHGRAEFKLLSFFAHFSDQDIETHSMKIVTLIENVHTLFSSVPDVLFLALGHPPPDIENTPCELSPGRKAIASAIVLKPSETESLGIWNPTNGNASLDFKRFGVSRNRKTWIDWLKLTAHTPHGKKPKKRTWWRALFNLNITDNS